MRNFNFDINEAISKNKIISFLDGPKLIKKEISTAVEDLEDAKESFNGQRYKWATIQAYYCIFHTSRALLYSKKYREKSHIYLAFAIKHFFVNEGLLSEEYYDNLIQSMNLRELADYKRKYSQKGAERGIKIAEESIKTVKELLKLNN